MRAELGLTVSAVLTPLFRTRNQLREGRAALLVPRLTYHVSLKMIKFQRRSKQNTGVHVG